MLFLLGAFLKSLSNYFEMEGFSLFRSFLGLKALLSYFAGFCLAFVTSFVLT